MQRQDGVKGGFKKGVKEGANSGREEAVGRKKEQRGLILIRQQKHETVRTVGSHCSLATDNSAIVVGINVVLQLTFGAWTPTTGNGLGCFAFLLLVIVILIIVIGAW